MGAEVDGYEQWALERINAARLDPWGEATRLGIDLNAGLAPGTLDGHARAPLAGNAALAAAAASHSLWMTNTGQFSHTGEGGSDPGQRIVAGGYALTGSWTWGENIAWSTMSRFLNPMDGITQNTEGLFRSAPHRLNLLSDSFREVGLGQEFAQAAAWSSSVLTEDFGASGAGAFVTGVAYADRDGDRAYSPGEGLGGVKVELSQGGVSLAGTGTAAAGGYAARSLATGNLDVTFSGPGLAHAVGVTVWMDGANVKLDALDGGDLLRSSGHTALGAGGVDLELLGVANLSGYGNGGANHLTGNAGANLLDGGAGNDVLRGGGGGDTLRGGDGDDTLDGGSGNDLLEGGAGNDWFYTYEGFDALLGGAGDDVFLTVPDVPVTIDGGEGYDVAYVIGWQPAGRVIDLTAPYYSFANVEVRAVWGQDGDDTILGTSGTDYLFGNGGGDLLLGGAGVDVLDGGAGNDTIIGGPGSDYMVGSAGFDIYRFDDPGAIAAGEFDTIVNLDPARASLVFSAAVQGHLYLFDYAGYGAMITVADGSGYWGMGLPGTTAAQVAGHIAYL